LSQPDNIEEIDEKAEIKSATPGKTERKPTLLSRL
jgi:hypothetical protein